MYIVLYPKEALIGMTTIKVGWMFLFSFSVCLDYNKNKNKQADQVLVIYVIIKFALRARKLV